MRWLLVPVLCLGMAFALAAGFRQSEPPPPDYEAMANCVAEQSYTHPNANKFAELKHALKLCELERK